MGSNADGIYTRKDRNGYWMHWTDTQGRWNWGELNVQTLQQARKARAADLVRVEQSRVLGFAPPGEDTFADLAARFLIHQKVQDRICPNTTDYKAQYWGNQVNRNKNWRRNVDF